MTTANKKYKWSVIPYRAVLAHIEGKISADLLGVLMLLGTFMDPETQMCFPSAKTLASIMQCDKSTISRRLHKLEELGYITITPQFVQDDENSSGRRQTVNVYRIIMDDNTTDDNLSFDAGGLQEHVMECNGCCTPSEGDTTQGLQTDAGKCTRSTHKEVPIISTHSNWSQAQSACDQEGSPCLSQSYQNDDEDGHEPDRGVEADPSPTGSAHTPHPTPLPPSPLPTAEEGTGVSFNYTPFTDKDVLDFVYREMGIVVDEEDLAEADIPYVVSEDGEWFEPKGRLEALIIEKTAPRTKKLTRKQVEKLRNRREWSTPELGEISTPSPDWLYEHDFAYREWVERQYNWLEKLNQQSPRQLRVGRDQWIKAIINHREFYRWRKEKYGYPNGYQWYQKKK